MARIDCNTWQKRKLRLAHWLSAARSLGCWCGGLGILLLATGCNTYRDDTQALRQAWLAGNDSSAARIASKAAEAKKGTGDAVIWRLEQGAALRAAGELEQSIRAFDEAAAQIEAFDHAPEVSLSAEVAANFTNLSYLPYKGKAYDRVMLATYQALNYLKLGDIAAARVALNQALERQREAVALNAERIEEAQTLTRQSSSGATAAGQPLFNVRQASEDAAFRRQMDGLYAEMATQRTYSDYVNPFSVFLDGLFFLYFAEDLSDLERARLSLNRVRGMADAQNYLAADLAAVERQLSGERMIDPVTYVIFETGAAPTREEVRIDIPLFIATHQVPYIGAALPRLHYQSDYVRGLCIISSSGQEWTTELLSSMDSVITTDFNNELPLITTRTLLSSGTKALAQYGIYQAVRDEPAAAALVQIFGVLYQAAMNQADLRTWTTLPKEFQYARIPTPADRRLTLEATNLRGMRWEIDLLPGIVNVVYVKSTSSQSPFFIEQFTLR